MTKAQMTAADFDALRPHLGRLTLDTVEIARRVLVDGETQIAVAQATGLTKQRVSGMVNRVRAAAEDVPAGWEHVETWLPPELAEKVRRMAAEAKAAAQQEKTHA